MNIRKAKKEDLQTICDIYSDIHTREEAGLVTIGWKRNIYPTLATAEAALLRDDLFVAEDQSIIVGAAIINQQQVDVYKKGNWQSNAADDEVMVLHTLVISPKESQKGYGSNFVRFYEEYARQHGCKYLRMDTNVRNQNARFLYYKLGYAEIGIVPCTFNGIDGVHLVLLEKRI